MIVQTLLATLEGAGRPQGSPYRRVCPVKHFGQAPKRLRSGYKRHWKKFL